MIRRYTWPLLLSAMLGGCGPTPISDEMTAIGFTPNPSPRDNLLIGTIYNVGRSGTAIVSLEQLCNPILINSNLVKNGVNYSTSNTTETQKVSSQSLQNNVSIAANILSNINASLKSSGKSIKQIYGIIKDAKIADTDTGHLNSIGRAMVATSQDCARDVKAVKAPEGIMREFIATVIYSVDTDTHQDFGADVGFQDVLKANLGATWDSTSKTFVSGNQLVYGYVLHPVNVAPLPGT